MVENYCFTIGFLGVIDKKDEDGLVCMLERDDIFSLFG